MSHQQLPERPSLGQLRRQAKDLLRAVRQHDAAALTRAHSLPAFISQPDDKVIAAFALHDAQSVVAREHGFVSWNDLRENVESITLDFAVAVDEFIAAATDRRRDRAERLLELHPRIATASFHTALLLGDAVATDSHLTRDPELATAAGGPRNWLPLHYICFTAVGASTPERERGLVAIARRLIDLGADPDLRFPWEHHGVHRPVLWGATGVVHSLPLARALLEAGANPSDGVTLTLAASGGDIGTLELLHEFGVDPNGPWATDGSTALYALLLWAESVDGALWLVDHGADPDAVFEQNGETPLHVAAARWGIDLTEALVDRGAMINRQRADGRTPYAIAVLSGNDAVAEWLGMHGADTVVTQVDRMVAAGSRGDTGTVRAMLAAQPGLRSEIGAPHYAALYRAAEENDANALEGLLACGLDPDRGDESMGMNALHKAAMAGWPEAVRVLLAHGASVSARDREFHATALVCAAEGSRHAGPGTDHTAVGRMLLDAGSPADWKPTDEPSEGIMEIIAGWKTPLPE
jgi:ankyrin repeat protein